MKSVRATLMGGLGNQMFIAATALAVANRLGVPLELDHADFSADPAGRRFALNVFPALAARALNVESRSGLPAPLRRRIDRFRSDVFVESGFDFDRRFLDIKTPVRLRGYFQSYKYFSELDVRSIFALAEPNLRLASIEAAVGQRWIGMHVRRGDYLNPSTAAYHGLCSDDYFERGLELLRTQQEDRLPVVMFTDQPSAVSERLHSLTDFVLGPDDNAHESVDLWAMANASGLVMSNSSFSWWAAYLEERPGRPIVAPRPWFKALNTSASDLLLPHWIQLRTEAT